MEAHTFEATTTQSTITWAGLEWVIFLIRPLYMIGMWFSEDQRENIKKTHI
jgi:hypothetical protein